MSKAIEAKIEPIEVDGEVIDDLPEEPKMEIKGRTDRPFSAWKSELRTLEKCEIGRDPDLDVYLDSDVHCRIVAMTEAMGSEEWLGYLTGTKYADGYYIDGIRIPKQTVSGASVDVDEPDMGEDVIGTVHSHHNMGSFHSGTDNEYLVGNHDLCLVYSNSGKYATKVRVKLPCGHYFVKEVDVIIDYPEPIGLDAWVKGNKPKIETKRYPAYGLYEPWREQSAWRSHSQFAYGRYCACCHCFIAYNDGAWGKDGKLYHKEEKCLPKDQLDILEKDEKEIANELMGYGCCY